MKTIINARQLRAELPRVVRMVGKGSRFTVLYRSRPAFAIVPVDRPESAKGNVSDDSLYRAPPVGRSSDGKAASRHDALLYS